MLRAGETSRIAVRAALAIGVSSSKIESDSADHLEKSVISRAGRFGEKFRIARSFFKHAALWRHGRNTNVYSRCTDVIDTGHFSPLVRHLNR
jgi:hypothetical protein